jgi:hypothetical protein
MDFIFVFITTIHVYTFPIGAILALLAENDGFPEQAAYKTPIMELASYRQIAAYRQWSTIGSYIYIYTIEGIRTLVSI